MSQIWWNISDGHVGRTTPHLYPRIIQLVAKARSEGLYGDDPAWDEIDALIATVTKHDGKFTP